MFRKSLSFLSQTSVPLLECPCIKKGIFDNKTILNYSIHVENKELLTNKFSSENHEEKLTDFQIENNDLSMEDNHFARTIGSEEEYYKTVDHIPAFTLQQLAKFLPRGIHSSLTPRDEFKSLSMIYEETAREKEDLRKKRKVGGTSMREMSINVIGQDSRGINRKKIYASLETEELKEMWRLDKERRLREIHEEEERLKLKEENLKKLEKKFTTQTGVKPPPAALYPTQKFGRDIKISNQKKTSYERDKSRLVDKFAVGMFENEKDETMYKTVIGLYRNIIRLVKRRLENSPDELDSMLLIIRKHFKKNKYLKDDEQISEAIKRGEQYVSRLLAFSRAKGQGRVESEDITYTSEKSLNRFHKLRKYWNRYFKQVGSVSESYCGYSQLQPYFQGLGIESDNNTLVVGGGVSQVCLGLVRDFNCSVTTIDISNVAVENMIRWTKSVPAVHFIHGDAGRMEEFFPNGTFDLVFDKGCMDSILVEEGDDGYVESQRMLLEVWRVLRNGGVYFIVTTLPDEGLKKQFVFMDWILSKVGEAKINTIDEVDENSNNTASYKFWIAKKPEDATLEIPDFREFETEYKRMKEELGWQ